MEYSAQSLFHIKQEEIKIPWNLLKTEDLYKTYQNAEDITKVTSLFKDIQSSRASDVDRVFK